MTSNKTKPVIHFWVPYPEKVAPSQRFRVELFLPLLEKEGFSFKLLSFFDSKTWQILYVPKKNILRVLGTLKGFLSRIVHLFQSVTADYIFLHREAAPVGPPVFEWILCKLLRKKMIFDFDDAIWIPVSEDQSVFKKWLKASWKVKYIIKWAIKVVGGNDFLCNYARHYNPNVFTIPTVVDTDAGHNKIKNQSEGDRIVIGWTGSHTTLPNLDEVEQIILDLQTEHDFDFQIISNQPPVLKFKFVFKKWDEKTEVEDLLKMNIGIMPSKEGPWFEGKCGFKLIQYQACGMPTVASPVGVNTLITLHKKTGFLASNKVDWKTYLEQLITNTDLRIQMGMVGRKHIEENYSLKSQSTLFLNLFQDQ